MDPHNSLISQVEGARGRMGRRLRTEETLVSDSAADRQRDLEKSGHFGDSFSLSFHCPSIDVPVV